MAELSERQAPFPSAAEAALLKGNKIEAIKIVRAERGVDLKAAKDIVERHVAANPGLRVQLESAQAAARGGVWSWVMAVFIIGALVYYFLTTR